MLCRGRWVAGGVFALLVATACSGGDGDKGGAIERGLREIPLSVFDTGGAGPGAAYIEIGDLAGLSEIRGLNRPVADASDDEVLAFMSALTGESSDDVGTSRVVVAWGFDPRLPSIEASAVEDEIGLDVGAIETFATFSSPPISFSVFTGEIEIKGGLDQVGNGVSSAGSGEDFVQNIDEVSRLRPIGQPLRLAAQDQAVALSTSTPLVEEWASETFQSLADDDRFVAVARALDSAGAVTAIIAEGEYRFDPTMVVGRTADPAVVEQVMEQVGPNLIPESFGLVGMGGAQIDGVPSLVAAYLFDDEVDAAASVDSIEGLWRTADSFRTSRPISEIIEYVSISLDGRVVTVISRPLEGRSTSVGYDLVASRDSVFLHR